MSDGADSPVRIVVITDLHLAPADEPPQRYHSEWDLAGAAERLAQTLRITQEAAPTLLAVLGDVAQRGDVETAADALRQIAASDVPARIVAGNHDSTLDLETVPRAVRRLARPNLRLAAPASERLTRGLAIAGVALHGDGVAFSGSLEYRRWPQHPVVVLSHFPLVSRRDELLARGLDYPGDLLNHTQLADALTARAHPTIALTGHLHVRESTTCGRLLQLGCAAQIEAPHDAAIVDIAADDDALAVRKRSIPIEDAAQAATALAPADETWAYRDDAWTRSARS